MRDPKSRFSDRAENYAKYRPGYPGEILKFLEEKRALSSNSVVADVGSGAGAMSVLFLENGNMVLGIEPNQEMRQAAEERFSDHPLFESVDAAAEDTTLADESVDLVVVANSLHWVERETARAEFSRILRPGGQGAVLWNIARKSGTPFLEAYTELISTHRTDDASGAAGGGESEGVHEMTVAFFDGGSSGRRGYETASFQYSQTLDFKSLQGLVFSSSSMPASGRPGSKKMLRDLEEIFRAHESGGVVVIEYEVSVYCGRLR